MKPEQLAAIVNRSRTITIAAASAAPTAFSLPDPTVVRAVMLPGGRIHATPSALLRARAARWSVRACWGLLFLGAGAAAFSYLGR
jgi:hypothetical protein